jgi:hypothetical protein
MIAETRHLEVDREPRPRRREKEAREWSQDSVERE